MDKIQIGENAGVLWRLMAAQQNNRVWDLEKLQEASGLSTPDFYAAVGWLAREDKVDFGENGQTHGGTLTVHVEYYL